MKPKGSSTERGMRSRPGTFPVVLLCVAVWITGTAGGAAAAEDASGPAVVDTLVLVG